MRGRIRKNCFKIKIFDSYNSLEHKMLLFKSYVKPLIESLFSVLIYSLKSGIPSQVKRGSIKFQCKLVETSVVER